ncbi:hypothetical protein, partial [Dysosmobacter sp.]|uniref:hypothetical protein n=1 Tax=Dysosmobacter sp. TaxID=2591382 RepID=UPI00307DF2C2
MQSGKKTGIPQKTCGITIQNVDLKTKNTNRIENAADLPMACTVTNIRSACKKKSTFPRQKETCFLNISRSEGHNLVDGLFAGLDGDDVHYRALAL